MISSFSFWFALFCVIGSRFIHLIRTESNAILFTAESWRLGKPWIKWNQALPLTLRALLTQLFSLPISQARVHTVVQRCGRNPLPRIPQSLPSRAISEGQSSSQVPAMEILKKYKNKLTKNIFIFTYLMTTQIISSVTILYAYTIQPHILQTKYIILVVRYPLLTDTNEILFCHRI